MDYESFKKEFYNLSTINLDLYKEKQMKRRICSLIDKHGFQGYDDFFTAIQKNRELYGTFISYLTINVSEFYRNPTQWQILREEILPALLEGRTGGIKIWSSACSTGDEPYTLVMILNHFLPLEKIKILATDIDLGAINKARQGIYPYRSVKELPREYLEKYFVQVGDESYKISDKIKNCVEFKQMDLLKNPYPQKQDLIVCRNVLIYFTEEAKKYIYTHFNKSMVDEGILFLGSTEQIIGSQLYGLKAIKTFFYKKIKNLD